MKSFLSSHRNPRTTSFCSKGLPVWRNQGWQWCWQAGVLHRHSHREPWLCRRLARWFYRGDFWWGWLQMVIVAIGGYHYGTRGIDDCSLVCKRELASCPILVTYRHRFLCIVHTEPLCLGKTNSILVMDHTGSLQAKRHSFRPTISSPMLDNEGFVIPVWRRTWSSHGFIGLDYRKTSTGNHDFSQQMMGFMGLSDRFSLQKIPCIGGIPVLRIGAELAGLPLQHLV